MILLHVKSGLILSTISTIQGLKHFASEAEFRSWDQLKGSSALLAVSIRDEPCAG
jgi:hypothetical protein